MLTCSSLSEYFHETTFLAFRMARRWANSVDGELPTASIAQLNSMAYAKFSS